MQIACIIVQNAYTTGRQNDQLSTRYSEYWYKGPISRTACVVNTLDDDVAIKMFGILCNYRDDHHPVLTCMTAIRQLEYLKNRSSLYKALQNDCL